MGQLINEARADLTQLGVNEPQIELQAFDTLTSFATRGLPDFLCDIYGEHHKPIPTSLLAALPPEDEARTECLLAAGAIEQAACASVLFN